MLNRQVPTLVAGVAKLAAGTAELNANTPQLVSGITQLNAGAGELADKLAAGAKQVNSIRTSDKTADMIAKPTTLKHKSYSYVPNYGHALAPYVLSVAITWGPWSSTLLPNPARRFARTQGLQLVGKQGRH